MSKYFYGKLTDGVIEVEDASDVYPKAWVLIEVIEQGKMYDDDTHNHTFLYLVAKHVVGNYNDNGYPVITIYSGPKPVKSFTNVRFGEDIKRFYDDRCLSVTNIIDLMREDINYQEKSIYGIKEDSIMEEEDIMIDTVYVYLYGRVKQNTIKTDHYEIHKNDWILIKASVGCDKTFELMAWHKYEDGSGMQNKSLPIYITLKDKVNPDICIDHVKPKATTDSLEDIFNSMYDDIKEYEVTKEMDYNRVRNEYINSTKEAK